MNTTPIIFRSALGNLGSLYKKCYFIVMRLQQDVVIVGTPEGRKQVEVGLD